MGPKNGLNASLCAAAKNEFSWDQLWRYRPDSNRCTRICNPVRSLSATVPPFAQGYLRASNRTPREPASCAKAAYVCKGSVPCCQRSVDLLPINVGSKLRKHCWRKRRPEAAVPLQRPVRAPWRRALRPPLGSAPGQSRSGASGRD